MTDSIPSIRGGFLSNIPSNNKYITGNIVNSPPGINVAKIDWVPGTIQNVLSNGGFLLRTPLGDMSVKLSGATFSIGDRVSFRLTPNGNLLVNPDFTIASKAPLNNVQPQLRPIDSRPLSSSFLSVSLSGVDPIKTGISPNVEMNMNANRIVSSIFPHLNSGNFAYAASLFPQTVRGGLLSRVAMDSEGRMKVSGRLSDLVEKSLLMPVPKIDGSYGWVSWNMPFYNSGYIMDSKWLTRDEDNPDQDISEKIKHTVVEIYLEFAGRVQLSCLSSEYEVDIQVISERIMPDKIVEEIEAASILISNALGLHSRFDYLYGSSNLLKVT